MLRPVRFVTAAALFDGHDAAITIIRRILQAQGCEVIHLGHDRSVRDVVEAAVQEDADGVAVSSYQGGHLEYFAYLTAELAGRGAPAKVFGGGGGVIAPAEIEKLAGLGVRIFSPQDGQRLGLTGMVTAMIDDARRAGPVDPPAPSALGTDRELARAVSMIEAGDAPAGWLEELRRVRRVRRVPVLGITGTGGSGKSSLTDELVRRFRVDHDDRLRIAVIAVDPSRRRGGGALLGDRIRMNALAPGRTWFRSMAVRGAGGRLPECLPDVTNACAAAGFDLVVVETPGTGQGDSDVVDLCDVSLYVMTPEFGAASQLEKIDMLDLADAVAINKFERRGAADAYRDVARQLVRNREAFGVEWSQMPVFGTSAARFADDGVTALHRHLAELLGLESRPGRSVPVSTRTSSGSAPVVPPHRTGYLADVAATVRQYHRRTAELAEAARRTQHLGTAVTALPACGELKALLEEAESGLDDETRAALAAWPGVVEQYRARTVETLGGTPVPAVALPRTRDQAELVRYLRSENVPGAFPFTAGVFRHRRESEPPARMFAGEGDAVRTNRRFHLLSAGRPAVRLSTAFDSVTLYGRDPDRRPDVYGKVGTSGVSVATLDDMRELFAGFDLCAPNTSVSMTINGPAPTILAMFLVTAIEQRRALFVAEQGRAPSPAEQDELRAEALGSVRGTVQADILKEDQGQNTCIFSTEFALRAMGDVQEWFILNGVRRFYSVSMSGYHIAEAGANPISQLAFTLANAFTYVESYLARGLGIDDFAPNLSFFFSNGLDAEYTVIGRVARRIWAIGLRDRYGAGERGQKLKYHVQTSGRSLHAQEMDFNDIRTTLQALCALYDNCNSLHTNAFDEAVTTPTEASVRRAMAIQLIIGSEWGLSATANPMQGSYLLEELTDLVEEAVLAEFDRISERGGVLGAMETGYQRGRIQDESMLYERRKHDGSLPVIGVNTFLAPAASADPEVPPPELVRGTEAERRRAVERLEAFQARHAAAAGPALAELKRVAAAGENVFAALMDAVQHCSLGQITEAFFEVGGQYRRNV
jgi:isobutyryl-CoA mutase